MGLKPEAWFLFFCFGLFFSKEGDDRDGGRGWPTRARFRFGAQVQHEEINTGNDLQGLIRGRGLSGSNNQASPVYRMSVVVVATSSCHPTPPPRTPAAEHKQKTVQASKYDNTKRN